MAVEDSLKSIRDQFEATGTLPVADIEWLLRIVESQHRVVVAGRELINHQEVSLLRKDLEIFDLRREPLAHGVSDDS